jgi:Ca2+-binding RTX toxin-like protein
VANHVQWINPNTKIQFLFVRFNEVMTMNKKLIYACICIGVSGLITTNAAWAKKNSHCANADVVLSKQYPNFDLDHGCAYNAADECDPEYSNILDDEINGLVIAGSNGKNVIHGSSGPDTICGRNGNDEIHGDDGDDSIYGDNGKDKLYGGLGNDEVHGGNGKDDLSGYDDDNDNAAGLADGEEDDDSLYGENGKDELTGGPGDDYLSGGNGKDSMDGGDGDDDVDGGKGKDDCVDTDDDLYMDDEDIDECEETELEDGPKHK